MKAQSINNSGLQQLKHVELNLQEEFVNYYVERAKTTQQLHYRSAASGGVMTRREYFNADVVVF